MKTSIYILSSFLFVMFYSCQKDIDTGSPIGSGKMQGGVPTNIHIIQNDPQKTQIGWESDSILLKNGLQFETQLATDESFTKILSDTMHLLITGRVPNEKEVTEETEDGERTYKVYDKNIMAQYVNLQKNTTYYFRVRSFYPANTTTTNNIYSSWSQTLNVTISSNDKFIKINSADNLTWYSIDIDATELSPQRDEYYTPLVIADAQGKVVEALTLDQLSGKYLFKKMQANTPYKLFFANRVGYTPVSDKIDITTPQLLKPEILDAFSGSDYVSLKVNMNFEDDQNSEWKEEKMKIFRPIWVYYSDSAKIQRMVTPESTTYDGSGFINLPITSATSTIAGKYLKPVIVSNKAVLSKDSIVSQKVVKFPSVLKDSKGYDLSVIKAEFISEKGMQLRVYMDDTIQINLGVINLPLARNTINLKPGLNEIIYTKNGIDFTANSENQSITIVKDDYTIGTSGLTSDPLSGKKNYVRIEFNSLEFKGTVQGYDATTKQSLVIGFNTNFSNDLN